MIFWTLIKMSNQVRKNLKLYLIGWYPSKYCTDFLKYKEQNRFNIRNKTQLEKDNAYNSTKDKLYKDTSNLIIYCINRINYSPIFMSDVIKDCNKYTGKIVLFFPKEDQILFSKKEIIDINTTLLLHRPKEVPIAINVVDLTNLLFELRSNLQYWNHHTSDGTSFYHFENDTDWEYV